MPRYIAFLRAINVGGRVVTMAELRRHFEALGFEDVDTFIASGNVLFSAPSRSVSALAKRIEERLHAKLGYEVATFLRTPAEVEAIARATPFDPALAKSALAMNVALLAKPLSPSQRTALASLESGIDTLRAMGPQVYWLCRRNQNDSKFSNAVLERALRVRATIRSMSTMNKLAAKLAAEGPRSKSTRPMK